MFGRRPRFAALGPGSQVHRPTVAIVNPAGIAIGAGVDIRSHAFIEALSAPGDVVVRIGDGTYIGHFLRLTAVGGVTIGRDVLISDRVYISDTGHNYEDVTLPIKGQGLRLGRQVEIGDGAWIGVGAAIVGNVRIGANSVVGANAVVTEDVPDRAVAVGNPARVVRRHDGDGWRRVPTPRSEGRSGPTAAGR